MIGDLFTTSFLIGDLFTTSLLIDDLLTTLFLGITTVCSLDDVESISPLLYISLNAFVRIIDFRILDISELSLDFIDISELSLTKFSDLDITGPSILGKVLILIGILFLTELEDLEAIDFSSIDDIALEIFSSACIFD